MNYVNINSISFLQLQICVNVADLGSFTDTANEMYMSQPTISKQISNLEKELGIILFIRGRNKTVSPTPAGKILIEKWRDMLDDFNISLLQASEAQACKKRPIFICTTPSANIDKFLRPMLQQYHACYPDVDTRVSLLSVADGSKSINSANVDIMICNPYRRELFLNDGLKAEWLVRVPWSVGMLEENPLAKKSSLSWDDLRSQQFVVPNSSTFVNKVNGHCAQAGFRPRITHLNQHFSGLAINIQNNSEVFLTDRYLEDYGKPGYVYFDLPGTESGLIVVSRKKEFDSRVTQLLQFIESYCSQMEPF